MDKQTESNWFKRLFEGRLNRGNLGLGLISSFVVFILSLLILTPFSNDETGEFVGWIFGLIALAVIVFNISLQVRRWHDLGSSGYTVLVNFVPVLNIIFILRVFFQSGQKNDNGYGVVPSEISYPQDILGLPKKGKNKTKGKDGSMSNTDLDTLERLAKLKKQGVITDEELKAKKKDLLKL